MVEGSSVSSADPHPDLPPRSVARRDWWKSAVVYQIYPRSFADSDGDGVGDLRGILDHLDHLELLGVDVVWLSPVYRSPMVDNGYDISDYHDVDPLFGTLEQLEELIAQLHARDMKLVMDLVVNHTSSAHAWFAESRSSTDNPKRDWYWWRSPRPGHEPGSPGSEPTNWGSAFSGPAWTYDDHTGEYYLHVFAPDQPDLNWENAEVRQAVYAMMRDWLDRGVDGFRMDVINAISKVVGPVGNDGRVTLPDGLLGGERDPHWPGVVDTVSFADTPAFVLNGPRVHEFLQEMHREVFTDRPPGLLIVGETPGCSVEEAVLYTDPSRGELDMVFQFEHVDLDSGPKGKWDVLPMTMLQLKLSLGRWQDGLAEVGWNSLYLGNHDQPRCVSRFGSDAPEHREQSAMALADRAAPAPRHAVRLPGRRARDEQRGLHKARAAARRRVAQPLRHRGCARRGPRRCAPGAGVQRPRQRAGADVVGRLARRRLHHREALARPPPAVRLRQRRRAGRRPQLGLLALPPAHRAAARRALRRARHVPDAPGRPRAAVLLRTLLRRHPAACRGQPVVRS